MSTPFYVSPAQIMADKADYARKGIARGRSAVVMEYAEGILFVTENVSRTLHKIGEIYDRIAFAAVGRYPEFENLRVAGVRMADLRGYSYDRRDVTGRGLANVYAQTLGSIFSAGAEKPLEVEIVVAEVGDDPDGNQIYRLTYDGTVSDERNFVVMGGQAEAISSGLKERFRSGLALGEALSTAVEVLARDGNGERRSLTPSQLEVAVLDRNRLRERKFRRIQGEQLSRLLDGGAAASSAASDAASDTDAGAGTSAAPGEEGPSGANGGSSDAGE